MINNFDIGKETITYGSIFSRNKSIATTGRMERRPLCGYKRIREKLAFVLVFQDCHDIRLSVHDSEEVHELEADLIGFSIGAESHKKAAVITTDIFELSIIYGSFVLQKNR